MLFPMSFLVLLNPKVILAEGAVILDTGCCSRLVAKIQVPYKHRGWCRTHSLIVSIIV